MRPPSFFILPRAACSVACVSLTLLGGFGWAGGTVTSPTEASLDAALLGGGLVIFQCTGSITVLTEKVIASDTTLVDPAGQIVLSGGGSNRLFSVRPTVTLMLSGLTLMNGAALGAPGTDGPQGSSGTDGGDASGGAVFNDQGVLSASNTTFATNQAAGGKGGKGSAGAVGTAAGKNGGRGGSARGGAIFNRDGVVNLKNCPFTGNTSVAGIGGNGGDGLTGQDGGRGGDGGGAVGGAIYSSAGGSVNLSDCTLDYNTATGGAGGPGGLEGGGGLAIGGMLGTAGTGSGGAVFNDGGQVALATTSFAHGTATGADGLNGQQAGAIKDVRNGGDAAPGYGGAISSQGGRVAATNCTFSLNAAIGGTGGTGGDGAAGKDGGDGGNGGNGFGGALYHTGSGSLALVDCTFESNTATGIPSGAGGLSGGGLGLDGSNGAAGAASGGGLHVDGPETTVLRCTFNNNGATGASGYGGPSGAGSDNGGDGSTGGAASGGAIAHRAGSLSLTNATLYANTVVGGKGGDGGDGGSGDLGGDGGNGGSGGRADGGGLCNAGGPAILVNATVAVNSVTGGSGGAGGKAGSIYTNDGRTGSAGGIGGGAIANAAGSVTCKNVIVADTSGAPNVSGAFLDGGGNLSSDPTPAFTQPTSTNSLDPLLGSLLNNGGLTKTAALSPDSPAVNRADAAAAPLTDQRVFPRVEAPDIGAFEYQPPALSIGLLPGTAVVLTWPVTATGYRVESTTSLPPGSWQPEADPVRVGSQWAVTNALTGTNRFYRLTR